MSTPTPPKKRKRVNGVKLVQTAIRLYPEEMDQIRLAHGSVHAWARRKAEAEMKKVK